MKLFYSLSLSRNLFHLFLLFLKVICFYFNVCSGFSILWCHQTRCSCSVLNKGGDEISVVGRGGVMKQTCLPLLWASFFLFFLTLPLSTTSLPLIFFSTDSSLIFLCFHSETEELISGRWLIVCLLPKYIYPGGVKKKNAYIRSVGNK